MPRSVPVESRVGAAGAAVVAASGPADVEDVDEVAGSGSATAAGNSSTPRSSRNVGTTRTAIAAMATTLSAPTYTRGQRQRNHDSTNQPARSTAFTTSARVLCTADVNAFGWTTNMTAIPPNSTTWGSKSENRLT